FAPACSSSKSTDPAGAPDGGDEYLVPPPITRTKAETELAPARTACTFKAGAWPAETLGTEDPVDSDIPINPVIVIMQENRSFDRYLGRLVAQNYYQAGDFSEGDGGVGSGFSHSDQIDGPPAGWSNVDSKGNVIVPHADDEYCYGVNHGWDAMHDDY